MKPRRNFPTREMPGNQNSRKFVKFVCHPQPAFHHPLSLLWMPTAMYGNVLRNHRKRRPLTEIAGQSTTVDKSSARTQGLSKCLFSDWNRVQHPRADAGTAFFFFSHFAFYSWAKPFLFTLSHSRTVLPTPPRSRFRRWEPPRPIPRRSMSPALRDQ